ncbi:MAG: hypothetical protein HOD60_00720 [Candidatus Nitrosopelagicus sp.]|nr:hypothetical protein [Candidatus Nitrosopelagicus sp.]
MTLEEQNRVSLDEQGLHLKEFLITDSDIVSYFENLPESESLEEKLANLIKIGISVSNSVSTTENVNYVEKAFENLDSDFSKKLNDAFAVDGKFSEVIAHHFGDDGKVIKEIFDPNRIGSPLQILKQDFESNLYEIREKLGINTAVEKEKERGTKKGFDFEDQCEEKLQWIARIHSDKLERTGDTQGKITSSKKGDFVLTLWDINKKIVFEMKDKDSISEKYIHSELNDAIENRDADYGVFVVKNKNSLPDSVGWFNEYDGNHLVCAVETDDNEEVMDGEMVHIAYKWARARLRIETSKEKKIDSSSILSKTSEIQDKLGDLMKIKRQCTNIDKSTEAIRTTTKETEKAIKNQVDDIIESISQ